MKRDLTKQYKAGLFVLLGIFLVIASLFILGGERAFLTQTVALHAHFPNVQGLNVGSVVSLSGINVGNVQHIGFLSDKNMLDIELKVDESYLPRLTEGSTVEIRTQGALGDKYVYILPGDPRGKALSGGAVLEPNQSSDLMGILSERSGEAGKIFDIISDLKQVVHSLAEGNRTEKIMTGLAQTSEELSRVAHESHALVSEIRQQSSPKLKDAIEKLDHILTKIDQGEGTLGALINDSAIHDQIKTMVGGSSRKKNMKNLIRGSIEHSGPERGTSSED